MNARRQALRMLKAKLHSPVGLTPAEATLYKHALAVDHALADLRSRYGDEMVRKALVMDAPFDGIVEDAIIERCCANPNAHEPQIVAGLENDNGTVDLICVCLTEGKAWRAKLAADGTLQSISEIADTILA